MLNKVKIVILSFIGTYVLRFIFWSCSWNIVGEQNLKKIINNYTPVMLTVWHGRMLFPIFYLYKKNINWTALASNHSDAEIMSRILSNFGFEIIRGSSSMTGNIASDKIKNILECSGRVAITSDGPRGPKYQAKPKSISIAINSGAKIITITGSSNNAWNFKSWDSFMLPKPFSRIVINIGKPISIETKSMEEIVSKSSKYITKHQDAADIMVR